MNSLATLLTLTILSQVLMSQRTQYNDIVKLINQSQLSWTAALSPDINYDDEEGLRTKLGALSMDVVDDVKEVSTVDSTLLTTTRHRPRQLQTTVVVSAYPASLDLRTKYAKCSSISLIRNQFNCGSCWAFSTMNSLSDRYCIAKSTATVTLEKFFSVEDVLECCPSCNGGSGNGCRGGMPYTALKYAQDTGISTGESLKTAGFCKPYYLDIKIDYLSVAPKCNATCTNPKGYLTTYDLDKSKTTGVVFGYGEQQMIAALNNGGTISVAFVVYQDFYAYRTGIYYYKTGLALGGHAVRLIGYGEENGVKYWLVANSWGTAWGELGFFWIRRGTNEVSIESNYFAYGLF